MLKVTLKITKHTRHAIRYRVNMRGPRYINCKVSHWHTQDFCPGEVLNFFSKLHCSPGGTEANIHSSFTAFTLF